MRENPWHLRVPNIEHHLKFKFLGYFHQLTVSCLHSVTQQWPSSSQNLNKKWLDSLRSFEPLLQFEMGPYLDHARIEDRLDQLRQTAWIIQGWCMRYLLEGTSSTSIPSQDEIKNRIFQTARELGRDAAQKEWPIRSGFDANDARSVFLALGSTPFLGEWDSPSYLIKRATSCAVTIELHLCPHNVALPEVIPVADILCKLHSEWLSGYAQALQPRMSLEHQVRTPRCTLYWTLSDQVKADGDDTSEEVPMQAQLKENQADEIKTESNEK